MFQLEAIRRQLFKRAPDTDATPQTGTGPGNNQGEGGGQQGTPPAPTGERTFTQAEMNAMIQRRLEEDRKKRDSDAEAERLKKAGEYEKLAETERQKRETAERERQAAVEESNLRVARADIRGVARSMGFHDPADAVGHIDLSAVEYDEKTGDPTNVDKLVADLAKRKPYLVKSASGDQGQGQGQQQQQERQRIPATPRPTGQPTSGISKEDSIRREKRRLGYSL